MPFSMDWLDMNIKDGYLLLKCFLKCEMRHFNDGLQHCLRFLFLLLSNGFECFFFPWKWISLSSFFICSTKHIIQVTTLTWIEFLSAERYDTEVITVLVHGCASQTVENRVKRVFTRLIAINGSMEINRMESDEVFQSS